MPLHVALLGDSTIDNRAYTDGQLDVAEHLRALLPGSWRATLLAVDGSTADDVVGQLQAVPADASHLVISVGGNDALLNVDMLSVAVTSTAQALTLFGARVGEFERAYRAAVKAALALDRRTILCTIYNAELEPDLAPLARVALMMFNDVILRTAFENRLDVIDLRLVCTHPTDFVEQIEPSATGGRKIADAIARAIGAGAGESADARVFAG